MTITVLGANGKSGVELVRQALAAGHSVSGVVRHEGGLENHPNLRVVIGDATDPSVITEASRDSSVIISTLGVASNTSSVMTDAVKAVIAASETTGCKRFILMSAFTVETDRLKAGVKLLVGVMKGMVDDKKASETLVRASGLDWTIVYPTRLTNQPKGSGVRVVPATEKIGLTAKIARADVAAFLLAETEKNMYVKAAVTVSQ